MQPPQPPHRGPGGWQQPAPGYPPPPGYPYAPYPFPVPDERPVSGLAVTALVCGILSMMMLTVLPAIAFGWAALHQIGRHGQRGQGMAIAGLILGGFWLLFYGGGVLYVTVTDQWSG